MDEISCNTNGDVSNEETKTKGPYCLWSPEQRPVWLTWPTWTLTIYKMIVTARQFRSFWFRAKHGRAKATPFNGHLFTTKNATNWKLCPFPRNVDP
jgi:hypothetical protein